MWLGFFLRSITLDGLWGLSQGTDIELGDLAGWKWFSSLRSYSRQKLNSLLAPQIMPGLGIH